MKNPRPRSADLGGLLLATAGNGYGGGWLGHGQQMDPASGTSFAELLSDMYNETCHAVHEPQSSSSSISTPMDISRETREKLVAAVDEWGFEPHNLEEEDEVLACTMILFEALFRIEGLEQEVGVGLEQLYPLIHHLRLIYRRETSYHNFEHALDVLQASYIFLRTAGMVPSVRILLDEDPDKLWRREKRKGLISCLENSDIFVLYIAAIGHDVAHPGITNGFMKNASAPLSQVYDNKSPLENLHCSVLLRVMRHHQLGDLLDDPPATKAQHLQQPMKEQEDETLTVNGNHPKSIRRLLYETVLATDMSIHQGWMIKFNQVLEELDSGSTTANDEDDLWRERVLMCQAIIKCADISNPSRPFPISRHWSTALMGEWTSQASLERCLGLPCTVQDKDDPYSEAKSQIFFATTFARPLWEVLVRGVSELHPFLDQCNANLQTWRERQAELEAAEAHTSPPASDSDSPAPMDLPIADPSPPPPSSSSIAASFDDNASVSSRLTRIDDYATAFPLALPKNAGSALCSTYSPSENGDLERVENEEDLSAGLDVSESAEGVEERSQLRDLCSSIRVDVNVAHSRPISNATSATLFSPGGLRVRSKTKHHHPGSSRSSVDAKASRERVHSHSSSSSASAGDSGPYSPDTESTSISLLTPSDPDGDEQGSESGDSEYHSASEWSSRSSSPVPSRSTSPVRSRSESPSLAREREGRSRTTSGMSEMSDVSGVSALSGLSSGSASQGSARAVTSEGTTLLKKRSFNGAGGFFKFGGKNSHGQAASSNSSTTSFWARTNASGVTNMLPQTSPHRSYTPVPSVTTSHTSTQDPAHAALRAAAESASPGLRKKRSMASRNSWSPGPGMVKDLELPKPAMVNGRLSAYSPSPSPSFLPLPSPSSPPLSPSLSPSIMSSLSSTKESGQAKDVGDDDTPKKSKRTKSASSSNDEAVVLVEDVSQPLLINGMEIGMVEKTKVQVLPV